MSVTPLPSVLVLVTNQHSCERLIRTGKRLVAAQEQLRVLSIQPRKDAPVKNEALEHLFTVSSELGAEMAVYYSDFPVKTAEMYVGRHPVVRLVMGCSPEADGGFSARLREEFPTLPITVVEKDGKTVELPPLPEREALPKEA